MLVHVIIASITILTVAEACCGIGFTTCCWAYAPPAVIGYTRVRTTHSFSTSTIRFLLFFSRFYFASVTFQIPIYAKVTRPVPDTYPSLPQAPPYSIPDQSLAPLPPSPPSPIDYNVVPSSPSQHTFDDIIELLNAYDGKEAYKQLKKLEDSSVDKAEWSRWCADACYIISNNEYEQRLFWLKKSREHALTAHSLNPNSIAILKILCSTTGRLAEESRLKDKLDFGFEFKTYLDKAIAMDPHAFELLHMRGRFSFRVATLNYLDRIMARTIGNLPQVTLDEALKDLLDAESLMNDVVENKLFIGKVYYAKGDYENAKMWLTEVANLECEEEDCIEQEYVNDAREMLQLKMLPQ
uniref:TPR_REGION domain-containing protein n=1 Tax=Heterorhabditis bacteriophora TaxID=37862 RepID=A0A1I7XMH3_HETBA